MISDVDRTEEMGIERLRMAERHSRDVLDEFRQRHGLARQAVYADDPAVPVCLLGLVLVGTLATNTFHAIVNTAANALDTIVAITLLHAVGMIVGFLLTGLIGLRFLNHTRPLFRLAGGIAAVTGCVIGFTANLLVAWGYAPMPAGSISFPAAATIFAVSDFWAGVSSGNSLTMIAPGGVAFIVSALVGWGGRWGFVDRYPGYSAVDHAYRRAAEALLRRRAQVHADEVRDSMAEGRPANLEAALKCDECKIRYIAADRATVMPGRFSVPRLRNSGTPALPGTDSANSTSKKVPVVREHSAAQRRVSRLIASLPGLGTDRPPVPTGRRQQATLRCVPAPRKGSNVLAKPRLTQARPS